MLPVASVAPQLRLEYEQQWTGVGNCLGWRDRLFWGAEHLEAMALPRVETYHEKRIRHRTETAQGDCTRGIEKGIAHPIHSWC